MIDKKYTGLPKDSILMIHQIRTIDQSRIIGPKVGKIKDNEIKNEINEKIKEYFDL